MKYIFSLGSNFEYSFMLQVCRIMNSVNYSLYLCFSLKLHGAGVQINISDRNFCDPNSTL